MANAEDTPPDPSETRHRQQGPSWRMDTSVSKLLVEHLQRLQSTADRELPVAVSRFLYLLFNHKATRPAAVQLRRIERPSTARFMAHQAAIFEDLKVLTSEFLLLHPHGSKARLRDCPYPECGRRLVQLEGLLRDSSCADLELDGASVVRATPAMRALECLRYCAGVHRAESIDDKVRGLWLRHKRLCWERTERLRVSPGRSLDVLLWWVATGETSRTHVSMEEIRHHLNRVAAEVLSASASFQATTRLVDRFRYSCELDADQIRAEARGRGDASEGESLTALAVKFLARLGVPAWSLTGRQRHAPDKWTAARPIAITTIAYGAADPHTAVLDGLARVHAELCRNEDPLSEALAFLLRLDGPVCEAPERLEFERFPLRIVSVDFADPSVATTERMFISVDEIMDAISRYEVSEGPATERTGGSPAVTESGLRPAARRGNANRGARASNGLFINRSPAA